MRVHHAGFFFWNLNHYSLLEDEDLLKDGDYQKVIRFIIKRVLSKILKNLLFVIYSYVTRAYAFI